MTHYERVTRAIGFGSPDRIPVWHFNRDETEGDILRYELAITRDDVSEWGYRWERLSDGTMGQPSGAVVPSWDDLGAYRFPGLDAEERLRGLPDFLRRSGSHYLLTGIGIMGTPADIHAVAVRLFRKFSTHEGGFIGYTEEYDSMGMSEENYRACVEAWKMVGNAV